MTKEVLLEWMGTKDTPGYKVIECQNEQETLLVGPLLEKLLELKVTDWHLSNECWWKYIFIEPGCIVNARNSSVKLHGVHFVTADEFLAFVDHYDTEILSINFDDLI